MHDFLRPVVTGCGHPWMPNHFLCVRTCWARWRTPLACELFWIEDIVHGKWSRVLCHPWTLTVAQIRASVLVHHFLLCLRKFLRIFILARDQRFNAEAVVGLHRS